MQMKKSSKNKNCWIDEYHQGTRYGLYGKILVSEQSKYQKISIIESNNYGKGLLLDDCWMTTELQEKYYHECLVHPAMCSGEELSRILIIGGGDGGSARECLRYSEVEHIDMIEIDQRVIELSQKYLPNLGGDAWTDPKLHLHIQDGSEWVKNSKDNSYDIIIVDGSDPQGPAKGLFNKVFFRHCERILKKEGVFAIQSESPEAFKEIHIDTIKTIREVFKYANPLYGSVPIYPSGWWSWTFAAKDKPRYIEPKDYRTKLIEKTCEIWSPRWQKGAFEAIPAFIERALK
tara:strand:- start:1830 stop:2696 length:867 start_codon:yes stop_codon:yes gene_type:complete